MADILIPQQAQLLIRRLAAGETLSDTENEALDRYRRHTSDGWSELQEVFADVSEDEIVAAFFEDERKERAKNVATGKIRAHGDRTRAASSHRP